MQEHISKEVLETAENELVEHLTRAIRLTAQISNGVDLLKDRTGNGAYSALFNILEYARYLMIDARSLFGTIKKVRDEKGDEWYTQG